MSNYWEKRAAKRMYEDMKTAEDAAEDIRKLYMRISQYIQSEGSGIFESFMRQTGLSEQEARRYLLQAKTPTDMQAVIDYVTQIQDSAKRQEILNWVKASATQSRLARLAELEKIINKLVPLLYAEELKLHQGAYNKIIQDAYLHKAFDIQQYSGIGKYVSPPDSETIDQLMRERWLGGNYSTRIWGNTNRLARTLRDELMVSFLTGRPQLDTWRIIDEEFGKGANIARRLIRTESCYLANQAQSKCYEDSGIKKYIYVATLDLKTSETCRELDGKRFLVKNATPGENYPPMHPWCRSTTIAWVPDSVLARMTRIAMDPSTGEKMKVPADMTYAQWYEKFVVEKEGVSAPYYGERNLTKIQYDNYRLRFGNELPYTYDEFIAMKVDKGLWDAWKKSYRASSESENYKDLTEVWKYKNKVNTESVAEADSYTTPDGKTFYRGNPDVTYDYKDHEWKSGEMLSRATGMKVEMCPRVCGKSRGISTPDYILENGARWDKKRPEGKGKDAIRDAVKRYEEQAYNFIVDLSMWKGDKLNAVEQAEKLFVWNNTEFIQRIAVIDGDEIIKIMSRK